MGLKKAKNELIEVRHNEEFEIELDSNPTTGFTWEANFDKNMIELKRKVFDRSSGEIGAGGKEKFCFSGLRIGETTVQMIYKRPWEDSPLKKISFKIKIV
jgi:inhibitor of cysteine peptidase